MSAVVIPVFIDSSIKSEFCLHVWRSQTYYVDVCVNCDKFESIMEIDHYDGTTCAGVMLGFPGKFVSIAELQQPLFTS